MIWIWLGVVTALILIECMSKNLVAIWFATSGIATCLLSLIQENYSIQVGVFLGLGIAMIFFVRPFILEHQRSDSIFSGKKDDKKNQKSNKKNSKPKKKTKKK